MGNRRRSITITTSTPHVSKSDGTNTLWGHSNSKLLSRLKPNTVNTGHNHQREVTPSASASLTLPLIQSQKIKRKAVDSKKSNDVLLDDSISKKKGFGKLLFRTRRSKSIDHHKKLDETSKKEPYQPIYQPYPAPSTDNRKSSGSCSIYSTFGTESVDDTLLNVPVEKKDSSEQLTKTRMPDEIEDNETVTTTEGEDDDDDEDDEGCQVFVDALEELKREKTAARLSKRLSGGHFGSAGGLMLSIMAEEEKIKPPPEDIAESMINWKRKSAQALPALIESNLPEIMIVEDDEAKECAKKLWHEDETFVQREKIAEWLGQSKSLNASALKEYMSNFDFKMMRLDSSFRKLCSKLYFRAEAQQIDRILEAFAKRYWECNPRTIFRNSGNCCYDNKGTVNPSFIDTVYAVVYSLLLLNTDLHVAQGNYTRMTRQAFIKNTMTTIKDQPANKNQSFTPTWEAHIESYLKDLYISVKHHQILHPLSQQPINNDLLNPLQELTAGTKRLSIMGSKRMNDFKRNINMMMNKNSGRESMIFHEDPIPRKSTSSAHRPRSPYATLRSHRRDSFSSVNSANSSGGQFLPPTPKSSVSSNPLTPPGNLLHFPDSVNLFSDRPPYYKEGVVMRKHLLESANQKARHREWRECLLIVGHGRLKMYGFTGDYNNDLASSSILIRSSSASFANLSDSLTRQSPSSYSLAPKPSTSTSSSIGALDNRFSSYTQPLGSICLNHTLSNSLPPPGYNRQRPHVFAIQEPNGGVFLFQTGSQEQILEWVATCNYWAARESKEPLQGGIGNIEYGWGSCLDDVRVDEESVQSRGKITGTFIHHPDTVHVSTWVPPAPSMISSTLDEVTQYENLQKYLNQLNEEINEHRELKDKMLIKVKGNEIFV
ncbi:hypothetical protein RMATCC62417_08043 [Rhizopus microsporus]|nr:hypothetical protein RMATCC62417_08043 [Rhizopus microsporus]